MPSSVPSPQPLRVISWNVLADAYVRPDFFPLSPPGILTPGARTEQVLDVLARLDADVIALQEAEPALATAITAQLSDYDVRWCPKRDRPDGSVTAVRSPLHVIGEERLVFADGPAPSGHVAHLVTVTDGQLTVTVANTHLRWAGPDTEPDEHVGVRQAIELVTHLTGARAVVIAADTNDVPGGPVRAVLAAAGFAEEQGPDATSVFAGAEPRALDVIAVRGIDARHTTCGFEAAGALPGPSCPSDHIPIAVLIDR